LFDYDLKDVLQVRFDTRESVNILRNDLEVLFSQNSKENLIAKIARSGNRHWWIYHQYCFSGADHASKIPKDTKTIQEEVPLDYIKEEDLFKNPELMLWKVVKDSFDPREEIQGHRLQRGDVVKIGRVRFKIKDITSPTYRKVEQKQKQQMKIYTQQVKREMQAILQGQLNSMREQRLSMVEQLSENKEDTIA
jgi:hypothetical protein